MEELEQKLLLASCAIGLSSYFLCWKFRTHTEKACRFLHERTEFQFSRLDIFNEFTGNSIPATAPIHVLLVSVANYMPECNANCNHFFVATCLCHTLMGRKFMLSLSSYGTREVISKHKKSLWIDFLAR